MSHRKSASPEESAARQAHIEAHAKCWKCSTCERGYCPDCDFDGKTCRCKK